MIEYLFELDSVCKSVQEVEIGQKALYEAIALRGSEVVLSYNQLSDSSVFWAAIEREATREAMLELCRSGRIRVNLYKGKRTAAQYIVEKIDSSLANDGIGGFVFSYLDLTYKDSEILKALRDAICFCDPDLLIPENCLEAEPAKAKLREYWEENGDKLVVFAKTILMLSQNENALVPQREVGRGRLRRLLSEIASRYSSEASFPAQGDTAQGSVPDVQLFCEASQLIGSLLENSAREGWNPNRRSDWYNGLKAFVDGVGSDRDAVQRAEAAEAIADIAYNFVIEDSVEGIERRYAWKGDREFWELDGFWKVFWRSLGVYWGTIVSGTHATHCAGVPDGSCAEEAPDLPDWAFALKFIGSNVGYLANHPGAQFSASDGTDRSVASEESFDSRVKRQERWWRKLQRERISEQFVILAVKITLLMLVLFGTDAFQDLLSGSSFLSHIAVIVIVELASEVLSMLFDALSHRSGRFGAWVGTVEIVELVSDVRDLATERGRLENYGKDPRQFV